MNEQFGVGSVLSTAFRVYFRNIIAFTLITALLYIPVILFTTWFLSRSADSFDMASLAKFGLGMAGLNMVLNSFVSATLTYGVVKELQGQRASIGQCIVVGFKRMLPVFGVAIVSALALIGGFILLVIPGFIVMCMLYVATPASVIEAPGVFGALRRSRDLTAGHKGSIFGLVFLLGLIGWGVNKIHEVAMPVTLANFKSYMYINTGIQIVLAALGACVAAVAYYALRAEKEGTSANELAAVFE
jgi:hypothetical protein